MISPKIALFGDAGSPQVLAIRDAVSDENGIPLVFDIKLGGDNAPAMCMGETGMMWGDTDFSDIHVIHIRCTAPNTLPSLPPVLNATSLSQLRTEYFREQEYQAAVFSFFEKFKAKGKLLINSLTGAYIDHDSKSQFYEKLRCKGFNVPKCMTTNNKDIALAFIKKMGKVVVKPTMGVGSTRIITPEKQEHFDNLSLCPVLFQEHIEGDTIRVHIVGDRVVLSLRVISEGGVDSRTSTKNFEYVKLPDEEEARIVKANQFLGLHYAAWDIIISNDNKYFYLDCNPGPFVMWIGSEYRKAVFKQLAIYMIAYAKTKCIKTAATKISPWLP